MSDNFNFQLVYGASVQYTDVTCIPAWLVETAQPLLTIAAKLQI